MNLEKKLLASTALFIAAATLAVPTFANDSAVNDGVSFTGADALINTSTGTITIEKSSTPSTQQITLGGEISSPFGSGSQTDGTYWTYSPSATNSSAAITTFSSGYTNEISYGIAYFSTDTTEYGDVSTMATPGVQPLATSTWTGSGNGNWTTSSNWSSSWSSGNDAVFTSDASTFTVTISSAVTAGTVTVSGGEYTFSISSGGSLTASTIDITGSGTSLTIDSGSDTNIDIASNTTIIAESGGVFNVSGKNIYLSYDSGSGETDVTATGTGSVVHLSAVGTNLYIGNYEHSFTDTLTATDGGTLKLESNKYISFFGRVDIVADGGTVSLSAGTGIYVNSGGTSTSNGTSISIKNGSSLSTSGATYFYTGSSISVDGTSTWTGASTDNVYFENGSSISLTTGANAAQGTANVSLGTVSIQSGTSISIVIDISSLEADTVTSVAILTATSIIFDATWMSTTGTTLGAGTTIAGDDNYSSTLDAFVNNYIKVTSSDFELEYWSYVANGDGTYTLYANTTARTIPEPGMFSLFAGLGTLGLIATRRRRKAA